jgi:hypothetical protein
MNVMSKGNRDIRPLPPLKPPSCGTCKHFVAAGTMPNGERQIPVGSCRRFPPSVPWLVVKQPPGSLMAFPLVSSDLVCGEFAPAT